MLKKLFRSWPLKLLAVILAVFVWFVIMSQADPSDTKTISNIPVTLTNTDLLVRQNKSYTIEGGNTPTVSVRVSASGSVLRELSASSFVATADVEKMMDLTGQVPVEVYCTNPNVLSSQVTLLNPSVKISYEDIIQKFFTVTVQSKNDLPEGYFIGRLTSSPRSVRVTGPVSTVSKIGSVVAEVDVADMTERAEVEVPLVYYDDTNQQMLLESYKDTTVGTETVTVAVDIFTMKSVPVVISKEALDKAKASLPDGYRCTDYQQSVVAVKVSGLRSRLAELTAITIQEGDLDLRGATESKTFTLNLAKYLPDGLSLMEGEPETVEITLQVEPLVVREFEVSGFNVTGMEEGYRYYYEQSVKVYIRALEADFIGFDLSMLSVEVDLSEYAKRPGLWTVPVTVECSDSIFTPLSGQSTLRVTIERIVIPTTTVPTETTEPPEDEPANSDEPYDPTETLPADS